MQDRSTIGCDKIWASPRSALKQLPKLVFLIQLLTKEEEEGGGKVVNRRKYSSDRYSILFLFFN